VSNFWKLTVLKQVSTRSVETRPGSKDSEAGAPAHIPDTEEPKGDTGQLGREDGLARRQTSAPPA
jgi:hypothetical protein